ncbi:MAG: Crp/Fnr family transcriptional regulator [Fibrobacterota bacterium]
MNNLAILRFSPLFWGLSPEEITALFERYPHRVHSFKKDQTIACAGTPLDHLLILISGSVRGLIINGAGDMVHVEDISAPNPLVLAFIYAKKPRYPVDILANGDVEILKMKKATLTHMLRENEEVLLRYLTSISEKALFLRQKMEFLSFTTIRQKLAGFFLQHYRQEGAEFFVPESQEKLSKIFGVTRPSLSREIKHLKNHGIINQNKKTFAIKNVAALKELIE